MATHPEVAARHSYARCLLERGIRTSSAVTMLQAKFNVGRSSAYEDLRIAQAELDASDDGPAKLTSPRFARSIAPGSVGSLS